MREVVIEEVAQQAQGADLLLAHVEQAAHGGNEGLLFGIQSLQLSGLDGIDDVVTVCYRGGLEVFLEFPEGELRAIAALRHLRTHLADHTAAHAAERPARLRGEHLAGIVHHAGDALGDALGRREEVALGELGYSEGAGSLEERSASIADSSASSNSA